MNAANEWCECLRARQAAIVADRHRIKGDMGRAAVLTERVESRARQLEHFNM